MAAVSPWFFTHYGSSGDWAFNKNWICETARSLASPRQLTPRLDASDDNLYATRWSHVLQKTFDPEFICVLTWNDYGESNCKSMEAFRFELH